MKQRTKTWIAATALIMMSFCAFSQEEQSVVTNPRWVSDRGYWVVESNKSAPLHHIVWFYNNDHVLVYKEALSGVKLNPAKRKIKMKLKRVLEASVTAWEQKRMPEENKEYVAALLR